MTGKVTSGANRIGREFPIPGPWNLEVSPPFLSARLRNKYIDPIAKELIANRDRNLATAPSTNITESHQATTRERVQWRVQQADQYQIEAADEPVDIHSRMLSGPSEVSSAATRPPDMIIFASLAGRLMVGCDVDPP